MVFLSGLFSACTVHENEHKAIRERILINEGWQFFKYDSFSGADKLIYDVRPEIKEQPDGKPADAKPTEREDWGNVQGVLKPWILPTGNAFLADSSRHYQRPDGSPGADFPFVQRGFDDSNWEQVDLPHDWAIEGPFYEGWGAEVGGGMGRLPSHGVAWYRKNLEISEADGVESTVVKINSQLP